MFLEISIEIRNLELGANYKTNFKYDNNITWQEHILRA